VKLRIVVERLDAGPTWRIGRNSPHSEAPASTCRRLVTSRRRRPATVTPSTGTYVRTQPPPCTRGRSLRWQSPTFRGATPLSSPVGPTSAAARSTSPQELRGGQVHVDVCLLVAPTGSGRRDWPANWRSAGSSGATTLWLSGSRATPPASAGPAVRLGDADQHQQAPRSSATTCALGAGPGCWSWTTSRPSTFGRRLPARARRPPRHGRTPFPRGADRADRSRGSRCPAVRAHPTGRRGGPGRRRRDQPAPSRTRPGVGTPADAADLARLSTDGPLALTSPAPSCWR